MYQYERTAELANGERTVEDIAKILGISMWATRNSIQRARYAGYPCKLRRMIRPRASEEDVLALADGTLSILEIAMKLEITPRTVECRLANLRASGHFAPTRGTMKRNRQGSMRNLISGLQPEVHIWLVKQCPKGSYLSEVIGAIIVDAYHEEITSSTAKHG